MKFFGLFGSDKTYTDNQIEDLVLRARCGDENAMAMIIAVEHSAKNGSATAKSASKAIETYRKRNPTNNCARKTSVSPRTNMTFGADVVQSIEVTKDLVKETDANPERYARICAQLVALPIIVGNDIAPLHVICIVLANGAPLTNNRIRRIGGSIQDPSLRDLFFQGALGAKGMPELPAKAKPFSVAGDIVGRARGLQMVRQGGPLSLYSKKAAWELGE